jgi:hypothetical protein
MQVARLEIAVDGGELRRRPSALAVRQAPEMLVGVDLRGHARLRSLNGSDCTVYILNTQPPRGRIASQVLTPAAPPRAYAFLTGQRIDERTANE